MESIRDKRILIAYSDPGGAKLMLALASSLKDFNIIQIISNRKFDFLSEFGVETKIIAEENIPDEVAAFGPELMLTGTSYTNDFELALIRHAKEKNIPVHSYVDNWQGFEARFKRKDLFILPDKIFVIDKQAKENGISEGISAEFFIVADHPYWEFLKTWKPTKSRAFIFEHYGIDLKRPLILLAPDPLSNVGGVEKYGFDESTVLKNLFTPEDFTNVNVVLKMHPNQNPEVFDDSLIRNNIIQITDNQYHNHLIYYSDLVISMFSNILVEADLLGTKALRYLEGLKTKDIIMDQSIEIYTPGLPLKHYYGS